MSSASFAPGATGGLLGFGVGFLLTGFYAGFYRGSGLAWFGTGGGSS